MQQQLRPIQIDPFFDGDGGGATGYVQSQPAATIVNGATGYNGVDQQTLSNMRPGASGLRGTIIPRATVGGIPVGTHPHVTADVEVNIDPHIYGQSSRVRLGDLNPRSIYAAEAIARELTPEPTNIQTLRLRGATIMHTLANQAHQSQAQLEPVLMAHQAVRPVVPQPLNQFPGTPAPSLPTPPQMVPRMQRTLSPLAAFDQQQRQPPTRELRNIDLQAEPVPQVGPPKIQVVFEMEHFGTLPVSYHDVIVADGFLVLMYDTRHQGSTKYFPPKAKGDAPRTALMIVGAPEAYLVQTTGIQFEQDGKEFCVLLIEQTFEIPAEK